MAGLIKGVTMNDPDAETFLKTVEARVARIQHNAHGVIYGSVTVMALLLATGHGNNGALETATILFGSIFAIVLAETFAKISSDAAHKRQPFGWADVRAGWNHSRPTLIAANTSTLLILVSLTGLYDLHTGIVLAQVSAIVLLTLCGFSIGWVIYGRALPSIGHGAFTGGIGLVLALVKYVLH